MKFYTNNTFEGICPVGTAAIVKARSKKHAAQVLEAELRQLGLVQDAPIKEEDMVLWPKVGEQVRILNDGSY